MSFALEERLARDTFLVKLILDLILAKMRINSRVLRGTEP
jgi:hypothetical protein